MLISAISVNPCLYSAHVHLTLLCYHGRNIAPGLFDRLSNPNAEIIIITLESYFLHMFLLTLSIHATLISMLLLLLLITHFILGWSY